MGMFDVIKICPNCKKGVKVGISQICPECGVKTIVLPSDMPKKPVDMWALGMWKAMSENDQNIATQKVLDAASNSPEEPVEIWPYDKYITSTPNFGSYEITEYLGVVSGTDVYLEGGVLGGGILNQEKLFGAAFLNAKKKLYGKAVTREANAVVDLKTVVYQAQTNTVVVLTGTAVKVNF